MNLLSVDEIEAISGITNTIVLLRVNWAIHAFNSLKQAEAMVAAWNKQNPNCEISLLQIDVSEQSGAVWDATFKWLNFQSDIDPRQLMYCGAGPMLWIRDGKVEHVKVHPAGHSVDELLSVTANVFTDAVD